MILGVDLRVDFFLRVDFTKKSTLSQAEIDTRRLLRSTIDFCKMNPNVIFTRAQR